MLIILAIVISIANIITFIQYFLKITIPHSSYGYGLVVGHLLSYFFILCLAHWIGKKGLLHLKEINHSLKN